MNFPGNSKGKLKTGAYEFKLKPANMIVFSPDSFSHAAAFKE
jgi:hypothetical protein